jgi:hypothetical protein
MWTPTNIFLFLWFSKTQNCSPNSETDTTSVSVGNSRLWQCGCLKKYIAHSWDIKNILPLRYVTCPSENTAISFSSLFAKEDNRKIINIQYGVWRTAQKRTTAKCLRFTAHGRFQSLRLSCYPNEFWVVYRSARTRKYLKGMIKKLAACVHFKGDTIVFWRMFVQMKHKEIYGPTRLYKWNTKKYMGPRSHGRKSLHSHPKQ